jgi:hypothetical protein
MRTLTPGHRSAWYTLDHVARILPTIRAGAVGRCPQCQSPLGGTVGTDGEKEVWLVRCPGCGRNVVLRARPGR